MAQSNSAVVLFLAMSALFSSLGMASFLLSLSYKVNRVRAGRATIHMYLKANRKLKKPAWKFYINRGFRELPKSGKFPCALTNLFVKEVEACPLHNYFGNSNDLLWLGAAFGSTTSSNTRTIQSISDFSPILIPIRMTSLLCMRVFQEKLSLNAFEHCAPDNNSNAATVLKTAEYSTAGVLLELKMLLLVGFCDAL